MAKILPVILSGGAGTRLWPCSVSMYPKQLLPLVTGKTTMLQETALRLRGTTNIAEDCIVICNEAHRFLVAEQLLEIEKKRESFLNRTAVIQHQQRLWQHSWLQRQITMRSSC